MQDTGREEGLEKTLLSIILSIDAYHGAVRCRIHVISKKPAGKRTSLISRFQSAWPDLDVIIGDDIKDSGYTWVVFVRTGDLVAKEWYSVLAYESFYTSVDIVSFNFYTSYFEVIFGNKMEAINNTTDLSRYMQPLIELNKAASCFWNKMYKSTLLSGIPNFPENDTLDSTAVIGLLMKCQKIAHVGKYLLIRHIDLRDLNEMSGGAVLGLNENAMSTVWNMRDLKDTIYAENAFDAMVEALRKSSRWDVLYRPLIHFRLIDDVCPKTWRLRRIKLWLAGKIPWISVILFPKMGRAELRKAA